MLKASAATSMALLSCGSRTLPGLGRDRRRRNGGDGGRPEAGKAGSGGQLPLGGAAAAEGGAAAAEGGAGGSGVYADPATVPEDDVIFPMGVISGAMRADSVVLWTYAETRAALQLRVFRRREPESRAEEVVSRPLGVQKDGYIAVRVENLEPHTWYEYAFFVTDERRRSAIGRVQTAFADDWLGPLRVGATSCTYFPLQPYRTLELLAREPIDAFLHLGDVSYNDNAYSLAEYRVMWRNALADPGYRALLSSVGAYFTWDDHEVTDDYDPEYLREQDPARFDAARTAFFEALPLGRTPEQGLWQSFRWGRTAEIFVLDCRSERRPTTRNSEGAIYLSRAQMDWLKTALRRSPAHFKVIMNSVPIAWFDVAPEWSLDRDRWQGFASQREELLSFIHREGINAWFVSGDFHIGMVHHVARVGRDRRLWEIAVGPGAQTERDPSLFAPGGAARRELLFPSDQFIHLSPENSFTMFEFDPTTDQVRVRFVGENQAVLFDRWLGREV